MNAALVTTASLLLISCQRGDAGTPVPTAVGDSAPSSGTLVPPSSEQTIAPAIAEKPSESGFVLDGKSFIEVPVREGLLPKGDMTIEIEFKSNSKDPKENVGGNIIYMVRTRDGGKRSITKLGIFTLFKVTPSELPVI